MSLNLTEVISQLQDIIKSGRFEYTPTNIESVKYINYSGGSIVTFEGVIDDATVADMERDISRAERDADEARSDADDLRSDLRRAEREVEDLEGRLADAREEIARLKNLP